VQQSNTYIVIFSVILTIVLGGLLSFSSEFLKPWQKKSEELDTKSQILGAVMKIDKGQDVLGIYNNRITSIVVDYQGNEVTENEKGEPIVAENVSVAKNFKLPPEERIYPVFKFHESGNQESVEAYILPLYGNGLWGPIWGYLALSTDLNTITGVKLDHETETPGLGARITSEEIQSRYAYKKILDEDGNLISVNMLKGEGMDPESLDDHTISGMSGATITAKGVNEMMKSYLTYYQGYFEKIKGGDQKLTAAY